MLNVVVRHADTYWQQGMMCLLQEMNDNKFCEMNVIDDVSSADIVFVSHALFLTFSEIIAPQQVIVLIHDHKFNRGNETERHLQHFYADDNIGIAIKKIKRVINEAKNNPIKLKSTFSTRENRAARLTDKERNIINGLASGIDIRVLAATHKISTKTISGHKRNAMRKLNVRTTKFLLDSLSLAC